jgi:hypothetical protein
VGIRPGLAGNDWNQIQDDVFGGPDTFGLTHGSLRSLLEFDLSDPDWQRPQLLFERTLRILYLVRCLSAMARPRHLRFVA